MKKTLFETSRGFPAPFGTSSHPKGVNFALFSKQAKGVSLCIFDPEIKEPIQEILLNPEENRTGDIWHLFVYNAPKHYHYGYRIDGPYDPSKGSLFDNRHIVHDPYCRQIASRTQWGARGEQDVDSRGVIDPLKPFHWGNDKHPSIPHNDLVIYEMHVRGFTQDTSSGATHPGTFLGIIEKIPHLKELGINAIELLPIFEFNELASTFEHPITRESLCNYWGYSTVNFFSLMNRYGSKFETVIEEFKTMVKELHAHGIEVILDVVYNHTAEGNQDGPTYSFKGIANPVYYILGPHGEYYNFTGCGNTFNCNHSIVRQFILDSLRYWVKEMHVDGFRFDLASIMTRGTDGAPLDAPPLIEQITNDPLLAHTKMIAEPWDAGGLYHVGSFPGGDRWIEWNGSYRDSVRRFIKGSSGEAGTFAGRLSGSEDLYGPDKCPLNSVNFVTCHDGFTLHDLVSYNGKHNKANGENNRDGTDNNESWNCGFEGETDDREILSVRRRQMRNFHLALMLSQGIPMLHMGDEYGHSKRGNNNTWGHDSPLNWFQWDILAKEENFFRFNKMCIAFRKQHPALTRAHFLHKGDVVWHGVEPNLPDWGAESKLVAFTLPDPFEGYQLYICFNANQTEMSIRLPKGTTWYRRVDTSLESPEDIVDDDQAAHIHDEKYLLKPYSAIVLKGKLSV
jgi:isoamylase